MRTIKFRGKASHNGEWLFGYLINICGNYHILGKDDMREDGHHVAQDSDRPTWVDLETIGQFTGLTDKNGKEIYEGDIIAFYELKTYCINPDCEPHLLGYSERLHKKIKVVRFEDGIFGAEGEYESIESLAYFGEWASDEEFMEELKKDPYFDTNGYDLDDVIGFEVIGNVFDNPELLKGGDK